VKALAQDGFE